MQEDEEEDDEEESSGQEDDGPWLLALNGNIADLENEEEDRDYDETGDHEDDDVKDEEGQEDKGRREKRKLDFNRSELGCEGAEQSRLKQVTKVPKVHE